ncbi:hypothetical protein BV25DRAFT_1720641 [Artomyces pyxidatus]|uniref:Uncharacterized protein n=1 Tax=Artomyces pyxidatus TaxID=48021 RepID=A0ACB8SJH0_9AGAM|nr:hypothetical protein BV25DRAFT_1720641 [Artomyces pyxidatus]
MPSFNDLFDIFVDEPCKGCGAAFGMHACHALCDTARPLAGASSLATDGAQTASVCRAAQYPTTAGVKRAVKRGKVEPERLPRPNPQTSSHSQCSHRRGLRVVGPSAVAAASASARRLQSTFAKLSTALLEQYKVLATRVHSPPRPVSSAAAVRSVHSRSLRPEA